jgi:SAM-dependent methyltransferase
MTEDYAGHDLDALAELPNYHDWIVTEFGAALAGRVIEVGAGIGNFSRAYVEREQQINEAVLVEPAKNLYPRLAERFAGYPHVTTLSGTLEALVDSGSNDGVLAPNSFDAAVLVNVLEHVEDDRALLAILRNLLRDRGALLLFVPAMQIIYGSLDKAVGHHRRYEKGSLGKVVRDAGFRVQRLHYFDGPGIFPWFLMGRVLRTRDFSVRGARLYDEFAIPWVRAKERLLRPRRGKNLFCIARKGD